MQGIADRIQARTNIENVRVVQCQKGEPKVWRRWQILAFPFDLAIYVMDIQDDLRNAGELHRIRFLLPSVLAYLQFFFDKVFVEEINKGGKKLILRRLVSEGSIEDTEDRVCSRNEIKVIQDCALDQVIVFLVMREPCKSIPACSKEFSTGDRD